MIVRAFFSALFLLMTATGLAQNDHFILIQSETNQPFYARINDKTYSSSEIGHLIIPQLKDTAYDITIGFPKDVYHEQKFRITLHEREMGLQLKNTGERGWVLYNWQTLDVTPAQKTGAITAEKTVANVVPKKDTVVPKTMPVDTPKTETKTSQTAIAETLRGEDKFSRMMAGVVNDSAFLYNTYVDKLPKKDTVKTEIPKTLAVKIDSSAIIAQRKNTEDSLQKQTIALKTDPKKNLSAPAKTVKPPIAKTDSSALAMNGQKKNVADSVQQKENLAKKEINSKAPPQKIEQPAFVQKLLEENSDTALRQVYIAHSKDGKTDTVDIIISLEKTVIVKPLTDTIKKIAEVVPQQKGTVNEMVKKDSSVAIVSKQENKANTVAAVPHVADSIRKDSSAPKKTAPVSKTLASNNCKVSATDYDVDKLRVKILAVESEDDKIAAARKYFKTKCFTTSQIKALSELFPSDEGRYRLFDTAYPFTSDTDNFRQLSGLLTAPYYINRFNAMIMP
jgi:hypothetical protein